MARTFPSREMLTARTIEYVRYIPSLCCVQEQCYRRLLIIVNMLSIAGVSVCAQLKWIISLDPVLPILPFQQIWSHKHNLLTNCCAQMYTIGGRISSFSFFLLRQQHTRGKVAFSLLWPDCTLSHDESWPICDPVDWEWSQIIDVNLLSITHLRLSSHSLVCIPGIPRYTNIDYFHRFCLSLPS